MDNRKLDARSISYRSTQPTRKSDAVATLLSTKALQHMVTATRLQGFGSKWQILGSSLRVQSPQIEIMVWGIYFIFWYLDFEGLFRML